MGSFAEDRLTRLVKQHDSCLVVKQNYKGVYQVLRKGTKPVVYDVDGKTLVAIEPIESFVMALTDNWAANGRPVEWGSLPILKRLSEIDLWNSQSFVNDLENYNSKLNKQKDRDFQNKTEDVVREWRPIFAKATDDILVGNLSKDKEFRRKREKTLKFKE